MKFINKIQKKKIYIRKYRIGVHPINNAMKNSETILQHCFQN